MAKPWIKCVCKNCEKIFFRQPSRIANGRGKCCSNECRGEYQSKVNVGSNNPNWRGGEVVKECKSCGKTVSVIIARDKSGSDIFCDAKCMGKYKSKHSIGEKNPNWRGGITESNLAIRCSINYANWRLGVFKRDKFACKICGDASGGNLHAHHIKRFATILEEIKHNMPLLPILDAAKMYNPLWDPNNGITMCENCHKMEHKINGR